MKTTGVAKQDKLKVHGVSSQGRQDTTSTKNTCSTKSRFHADREGDIKSNIQ